MAVIVEFDAPEGLTLTLKLYAYGSDTEASSTSSTEKSNDKGRYESTISNSLTDWHHARIIDGSNNLIARGAVKMSTSNGVYYVKDSADNIEGTLSDIIADTNELQADWADGGRLDNILDSRASQSSLDTLDDYVDTEVAAIKAKTDNLPSDPADASDVASAFSTVNATLATLISYVDTEIAAIKAKTDNLPSSPASSTDAATALTTAQTESYANDNANATIVQLLYEIRQNLTDFTISGTTKTVKKKDGSTTAATYTLNDATNPTGITRTT